MSKQGGENMLVENQKIKMKWNGVNQEYYQNKGYVFTKYRDVFYVDVEDLSHGSNAKLQIKCDDCGKEYAMTCHGYFKGYEKKWCLCNCKYWNDGGRFY